MRSVADRLRAARPADVLVASSYAILGTLLVLTRSVGLDRSFWHDEILTVTLFLRRGPQEILAGDYIPNNHELYSLMAWATSTLTGESEIALRLLSVVPFVAGAVLVTVWLHARLGPGTALLYLFLAACSPLLLDLSRQARGYGLAFLAMSVLVVGAFEAERTRRTWTIVAFFVAGLVGTLTLPIFGIGFVATGAVLLLTPELRRRVAWGLAGSVLLTAAWYAPNVDDMLEHSQQEFGAPIPWYGIVTAPLELVLIPGVLWVEGAELATSFVRFLLVAFVGIVLLSSPLLRDRSSALLLSSSVVATLLVVWIGRLYLSPRFVSYLLVPLLVLLASGTAHLLRGRGRRPGWRPLAAVTMIALVFVAFVTSAPSVIGLPREAHRDAVEMIQERAGLDTPVLTYMPRPADLDYYLGRPVRRLARSEVVSAVCGQQTTVAYVTQPLGTVPVIVPCLERPGVEHRRLEQYSQGEEMHVWLVPPG
jgi:hypothetical protein